MRTSWKLGVAGILTCCGLVVVADAGQAVFYRLMAEDGSGCRALGAAGITWTNVQGSGGYKLEWDLAPAARSNAWEEVSFGPVTGLTVSVAMPRPSTARPDPARWGLIPGGAFWMGNSYTNLNTPDERPVHAVDVRPLYMERREVSRSLWIEVRGWGATNGYTDISEGGALGEDHPIQNITWFDAVKWCNARSEKDGLVPVYCTDSARTSVYRVGEADLSNACVRTDANGYRLPTEAEWEKAARGGLHDHFFPWASYGGAWSNHIGRSNGNYRASGDPFDTTNIVADVETTPVAYYSGAQVIDGTVHTNDMVNGYGLYDAAGNVYEWCWDRYDSGYYSTYASNAWPADVQGPNAGETRVLRGGSWNDAASGVRCANRFNNPATSFAASFGLRCCRGL